MNENICRDCKMTFESSEQLANHVKRFCINSDYGNLNKLEQKHEYVTKPAYPEMKPSLKQQDPQSLKNYGGYTLDQIKSNLKTNDDDFKRLENAVLRKKEDELIDQIDKLKQDRQQMRVVSDQDEHIYSILLQEVELKKEREFQCRIEKEQIRKLINEIDSWKMSVLEEQKKQMLEKLLVEREDLKNKQLQLIEDIKLFTRGHKTFFSMEQAQRVTDNRIIASAQYSEAKQQLVKLHTRLEYMDAERNRIQDNVERIKLGDFGEVRRGESSKNSIRNSQQILNDQTQIRNHQNYEEIARMKEKIAQDAQRLEQLKREQMERVDRLKTSRPQSHLSNQVIDELQQLKNDYQQAGGQDPKFLNDVNNLESFYKGAVQQPQQLQQSQQQFQQQQQQQPNYFQQQQPIQIYQQQPMFINPQQQEIQTIKPKKKDFNDPFQQFSRKKEFFLQNNVRGVDLTREEQILMNLQAQEVDSLRMISRIPIGTEIYRFKMEQYKELSTMRAEMEKIIQEQRLQRVRRNFEKKRREKDKEFENNKWVDDQRKFIIENRLRNDFGEARKESHLYDPAEGLVIHWDYVLGLPRKTKLAQFVFAVFNNMQQLNQPKLIEPYDCEIEGESSNRVLIGETSQLYEIPAHPEVLIIVEVQLPVSKKLEENIGKTQSYGWTQIDLFDQQRQLKRGKFKCPLYKGPTDATITIENIAKLEPIPNAWFHMRITYPNDEDLGQVRSIYPEQTAMEYNIPYIHLRSLFDRNYEAAIEGKEQNNKDNGEFSLNGQNYKVTEEVEVFGNKRKATPQIKQYVLKGDMKKGYRVQIHFIQNKIANNFMRVMCAALTDQHLMMDPSGQPLAFNTTIHDPSSPNPGQNTESNPFPLIEADPQMKGISNKAARSILIEFNEEYRFFYNFQEQAMSSGKTIYLGFQVVEKNASQGGANTTMTMGDYEVIGWSYILFVKPDGSVRTGRNTLNLFNPPLKRPPLDESNLSQSGIKLDYSLYDFEYNDEDMIKWKNQRVF
ncbi:unnamed protein product [Paramecium pentaurelia]|uniref:Uncharacterized protein n=1 Tax=Paramecium pentaurelia TaxID=43138 RepID=A0A8S1UMG7_9CILI|nr:unnamed protein product [Paramecium pentaurelia]